MKTSRVSYIDITKILAIVLVLMFHVPSFCGVDSWNENLPIAWNVSFCVSMLGVPLFMMSTGALLLDRDFSSKSKVVSFYKNNLITILVPGILWSLIYYVLLTDHITIGGFIKTLLFMNKPEEHLWYIRMIILYYLFMPFISRMLKFHSALFFLLLLCCAASFVYSGYLIVCRHEIFPTIPGLSFFCYLIYMYIGFCIFNGYLNIHPLLCSIICVCSLSLICYFRSIEWFRFFWYDNPLCLLASISIFGLVKSAFSNVSGNKYLIELSKMTFGVYLCHMLFLRYGSILYTFHSLPFCVSYIFVLLLTLGFSVALIIFIKKYTCLSKFLFRY